MPVAASNGLDLMYATSGDPAHPTVVLISGLGGQLIMWPMAFVHTIVIAGYHVVRFDNRDVGRSTHFTGKLNLSEVARALRSGETPSVPYLLGDMAGDAVGLLDHLGIDAAHVVGISMGGAIAQELAIRHPDRLRTLTCLMASTGAADVGQPNPTGNRALFRAPPLDREGAIVTAVESAELLAGEGCFDRVRARMYAAWAYDRAFDPQGVGRQLGAIWASPDRTQALGRVTLPTLIIHGADDPLVNVSGGRALAAALPDSRYVEISGLAHHLSECHWPEIIQPLLEHLAAG